MNSKSGLIQTLFLTAWLFLFHNVSRITVCIRMNNVLITNYENYCIKKWHLLVSILCVEPYLRTSLSTLFLFHDMIQRVVNACGGDWQIHEGEQKVEMASRGLLLGTQQSTSSVSHFPYFMLSIFILLMVPSFKRGTTMRWETSVCCGWGVISLLSKVDCSLDIQLINSQIDHCYWYYWTNFYFCSRNVKI